MRISYEQILATLEAGLALAQRLGLDMELATTRFLAYREDLSRLIDVVALRQRLGRLPQDVIDDLERRKGRYVAALVESAQFGEIATKLAAVDADVLRPKLRDALRGPILPSDEDANSNQARNTIFELVLAARLHAAGLTPILGDRPDVRCVVADIPMSFECKRVFSEKKLALRISQAADSLQKDLTAAGPHAGRGVIVVSTAKLFSPAQMPLAIRGDPVAQQALNEWLEAVAVETKPAWGARIEKPPLIGIMFHVSGVFDNAETGRYDLGEWWLGVYHEDGNDPAAAAFVNLGERLQTLALRLS